MDPSDPRGGVPIRREDRWTVGFLLVVAVAVAIVVPGDPIQKVLNGLGMFAVGGFAALGFVLFAGMKRLLRGASVLTGRSGSPTPSVTRNASAYPKAACFDDGAGYRIYTRAFDVEVDATHLDSVLGEMSAVAKASLDEAWSAFSGALLGWRTKAQLVALEAAERVRAKVSTEDLANTVVSILIDHSGSMKGQSMLLAAGAAETAVDLLERLGVAVEVLGYTTAAWRGGRARSRWQVEGRPVHPGRLNELLHIVYRAAGDRRGPSWSLRSMLRPDLAKENIDGEALEWAATRLRGHTAERRILIVVSDGAPCDDATLQANDMAYLDRHLHRVIEALKQADDVRLAAIGIGYDVSHFYKDGAIVISAAELGSALIETVERVILEPWRISARPEDPVHIGT